ncbi:ABC-type phosphate transport system, periplasmic component [Candidatus Methanoperedens nitroreducens]|uniref:ABC-type phosphate transport system, periplasmic component n=1 Tax=Candidatus Methanoperedens nitratireducens TaxID=1392998 RepID=A0A062V378_9EURY|nr:substrate-binding domain-containing protein [Candidatus Methanoperedens nitroreducens]KCZ70279.1 ABC-type phosphate transport system, periplasmic component [Candidatus Methanoperedens nitroreducens]MDJ1423119.1 substrate-binding domain-containing protein [Candidatus Methanoperedens sp.]
MKGKFIVIILITVLIGALFSGCIDKPKTEVQSTTTSAITSTELEGTITLSGAWALYPMAVRWGEEFQKLHPNVRVEVSAGGAGKGMADAIGGLVDIGMVSRAIDPSEIEKGAYPIAVAKDAVVPVINAKNPVLNDILSKGIKRKTFEDIYINGTVKTWGEVVGRPEIKDEIHVYTRSDAAGAPEVWAKYLGKKQENLKGIGVYGDPGLLAAVQKDPLGIGFNNYNYVMDMKTGFPVPGVQVAPFDVNENGIVDPDEDIGTRAKVIESIKKEVFPHPPARVEYFVTKGKPAGLTAEFIKYALTDGQKFLDEVGYIELPEETLEGELRKLE